jgi:release factor glutamine methyltransferase
MDKGIQTISQIRRSLIHHLSGSFPANEASSITRIILEHVGFTENSVLKNPSAEVTFKIASKITKIVNELKKNRPIQYILGQTWFMDLVFKVNEHVLIPRPETEDMVLKILQDTRSKAPNIIDIGSGSGCIAIALAHNIPGSIVTAMDVDDRAIQLAKKNALIHNVAINFMHENIFDTGKGSGEVNYDIIVSNPPYVTQTDKLSMSPNVTEYEPAIALFVDDDDPLVFYREIIRFSENNLSEKGTVWVEINERFGAETSQLFTDAGYGEVLLLKDIHGKDRFIKAKR